MRLQCGSTEANETATNRGIATIRDRRYTRGAAVPVRHDCGYRLSERYQIMWIRETLELDKPVAIQRFDYVDRLVHCYHPAARPDAMSTAHAADYVQ